ncbi:DUF6591 domain-containing protein [Faecalibacter bovis]|uniref:DUF6591 domain-containing protein n=1 Tax=Faecalibacter bovis TaxID=2898187 RepID=A0ABX7XAT7_9FLAO|nr:DUF6591 domain-containing protein [Faecalibacter bovis]MBS7333812.1 hypothetical protein [Weeksellaceae bacterium]QTV05016.1 hypothetical protein J9309_09470 [Faecalibacter bovis]
MKIKTTFISSLFVLITFTSCSNEKESTELIGDVASILNTVNEISGESEKENSEENNNENESSEEISTNGNEDVDQLLNEYESYINEYSKLAEIAESGDPTLLLEYATKLDKAKELKEMIQQAKEENNLTDEQISRLIKLQSQVKELAQ